MPHFPYRAGNYILFAELGTGTLGTTYIGREAAQSRAGFKPLAIRILDPHMTQRPETVRMFLDEQRAAGLLQHVRVAAVHEVGQMPDGTYFVAGEYVHGVPLREVMRNPQAQLSPAHAVHVAMQLCDALHYAHERYDVTGKPLDIVHGQLSSDSVLIGFDGNVKIIEFGSLRTRNATVTNVSIPARLQRRTPYMAPELRAQVQANSIPNIDRRADIYSVGAVLWEMLTGESLTVDENDEPPPPPSSKREVPADLDAIVKKALNKKKDDRYPTALAMRLALSTAAQSLFGESSVATILARNMTVAFRQRKEAFQEQIDLWKKFEPDTLPVSNEPLVPSTPANWRNPATATGTTSAYQSQRVATGYSQRVNVQSVNVNVNSGGMGVRPDSIGRNQGSVSDENQSLLKKPLFLGLLGIGLLTLLIAVVMMVTRPSNVEWSILIDSAPRGAEIRVDGRFIGNTPQRLARTSPPTPQKIEIIKKNYHPYVREVSPQPGGTVRIDAELEPDEQQR
jgi:serine/threonine-protein kinase